jgi:hypothetical protein
LHGDEVGGFAGSSEPTSDAEEVDGVYVFPGVLLFKFGGLSTC